MRKNPESFGAFGPDGSYHPRQDLGGADAMRDAIEEIHQVGRRAMQGPPDLVCSTSSLTPAFRAWSLSLSLRGGELKGVRVPQGPSRRLRDLVHLRQVTTRLSSGTMCRIKMLLLSKGIEFPGER